MCSKLEWKKEGKTNIPKGGDTPSTRPGIKNNHKKYTRRSEGPPARAARHWKEILSKNTGPSAPRYSTTWL